MNIGLVLSGGMAKGAYQAGALKALAQYIPLEQIEYVSCASIGVLNGYTYATDNVLQAEKMWKKVCCDGARYFVSQVLKSSMLQHSIENIYRPEAKLPKKFYCSLYDYNKNAVVYKNLSAVSKDKTVDYLKASVAMPIYNKAVIIDDVSYYDGAMIDNIPVFPLLKHPLDYIICIYFDDIHYKFENANFDKKIIKINFPCDSIIKKSLFLNKESIDGMLEDGYERTSQILDVIFSRGPEDLDYIYKSIQLMDMNSNNRCLRVTGDVLVANLNKIAQKYARRVIR